MNFYEYYVIKISITPTNAAELVQFLLESFKKFYNVTIIINRIMQACFCVIIFILWFFFSMLFR